MTRPWVGTPVALGNSAFITAHRVEATMKAYATSHSLAATQRDHACRMLDALRVFRSCQRSARADRWHHCCARLRGGTGASEGRSIIARFEGTIEVLCGR